MNESIQIACDEYIKNIQSSYYDPEIDILSFPYFSKMHKEEVLNYIKDNLGIDELIGCPYDQIFHQLLKKPDKHHFFSKIFTGKEVLGENIFDFALNSRDEHSNTLLINLLNTYMSQKTMEHTEIHWYYIKHLLSSDYKIQAEDEKFSEDLYKEVKGDYKEEKNWVQLRAIIKSQDLKASHKEILNDQYVNRLCCLSSLKMRKNIGIGFPNLLSTVNLVFTSYKKSGDIMLRAIQAYGLEKQLLNEDKKGTFKRLKTEFLEDKPKQDEGFEKLAIVLFPDLEVEDNQSLPNSI